MFDYAKLNGRIKEKVGTQARFAKALGVSEPTLSKKLNNKTVFTADEINRSCEVLEISFAEIPIYFFAPKV
ncbi:MAG: DUF739 family protein [Clostridia bacterium]|nr:DUF739 family protein [Clostridia bacterium]